MTKKEFEKNIGKKIQFLNGFQPMGDFTEGKIKKIVNCEINDKFVPRYAITMPNGTDIWITRHELKNITLKKEN